MAVLRCVTLLLGLALLPMASAAAEEAAPQQALFSRTLPSDTDLKGLESTLSYTFTNRWLLRQALVHPSFGEWNNHRFSWLGDAIMTWVAHSTSTLSVTWSAAPWKPVAPPVLSGGCTGLSGRSGLSRRLCDCLSRGRLAPDIVAAPWCPTCSIRSCPRLPPRRGCMKKERSWWGGRAARTVPRTWASTGCWWWARATWAKSPQSTCWQVAGLGLAVIRALEARPPPRCLLCHAAATHPLHPHPHCAEAFEAVWGALYVDAGFSFQPVQAAYARCVPIHIPDEHTLMR